MRLRNKRVARYALILFFAVALTGCYVLRQAAGQFQIVIDQEPIDPLIESDRLDASEARKLLIVEETRDFAFLTMGLTPSDNYTTYYDTRGKPVSYVLSACRKDRFENYVWTFPIAGSFAYKGFFSRKDALAEARLLQEAGYDTSVGEVAAYSTLGWFRDPVYSTMLRRSEANLVSVIIHELAHGTVYADGMTDFNEEFATFVGTEGAIQFLAARYGEDSRQVERAREEFREEERFNAFMRNIYDRLDTLYGGDASREEKLRRREDLFAGGREEFLRLWPRPDPPVLNNAVIVAARRYGGNDLYRRVFESAGGSWALFLQRMRLAAASPDPARVVSTFGLDTK